MNKKHSGLKLMAVLLMSTLFFQVCKKSNNMPPLPRYYLTATINGTIFTTSEVGVVSSNGISVLIGQTINGTDSTLIVLGFPLSVKSGVKIPIDIADTTILAYKRTKPTLLEYTSDSSVLKGQGTFMITSIMKDSVIAGTFSGKVIDNAGTIISITNGSFRSLSFSNTKLLGLTRPLKSNVITTLNFKPGQFIRQRSEMNN